MQKMVSPDGSATGCASSKTGGFMSDANQLLAGQVAVITGAGSGIGAAIARKMGKMGAVTVVCGRTRDTLQSTATAISQAGAQAEVIECNVTNLASVESLAKRVDS